MSMIVVRYHDGFTRGKDLPCPFLFNLVVKGHTLVANVTDLASHPDYVGEFDGRAIDHMHIRHDQAEVKKGFPVKKTSLDEVSKTGLLQEHQEMGIVDMPLRIQVTVSHLEGVMKVKIVHAWIIPANCFGVIVDELAAGLI
jgi:hypothetical protein